MGKHNRIPYCLLKKESLPLSTTLMEAKGISTVKFARPERGVLYNHTCIKAKEANFLETG